jgi:hypothetical protein
MLVPNLSKSLMLFFYNAINIMIMQQKYGIIYLTIDADKLYDMV